MYNIKSALWIFAGLMLFASPLFAFQATMVNGANDPSAYYFNTDMSIETGFTMSIVSGGMISGNPSNIQGGDKVCSNSVIRVTPTATDSKWALSNYASRSTIPYCDSSYGYCPPIYDSGGISYNRPVKWLDSGTFDSYANTVGDPDYHISHNTATYGALGGGSAFFSEPVTYDYTSTDYTNKEGFAGVFCKGSIQVFRRGQAVGNQIQLPNTGSVDVSVVTEGSNTIKTQINDVSCFGAVVRSPLNIGEGHDNYYQINYYANSRPSFSVTGENSVNVNVQSAASTGACILTHTTFDPVRFTACKNTPNEGFVCTKQVQLRVHLRNSGNKPIKITGVTSSNSGYVASPAIADPTVCWIMGIPSSMCPSSNGFYDADTGTPVVQPGGAVDVYVNIKVNDNAVGGTDLTFTATTIDNVCGSPLSCNDILPLGYGNGIFSCTVSPPTMNLGYYEIGKFKVKCEKLSGDEAPCAGDNWQWTNGLFGMFYEKDNTHANGISTSGKGSSGWVKYTTGDVSCHSEVTISSDEPKYSCVLDPTTATMYKTQSKYFSLSAAINQVAADPKDAKYMTGPGLVGTVSNSSIKGTTFTAADQESSGNLYGFALFDDPNPDLGGAGCRSAITVKGVPPDPESCTIIPATQSMKVKMLYRFYVECRDVLNNPVPCIGDDWKLVSLSGGITEKNSSSALAYTTSSPNTQGKLTYHSKNAICSSDITVSTEKPEYVCDMKPDSATLIPGQSMYFTLNCTVNGIPQTPDETKYPVDPNTLGSTSNSSLEGTTFTGGNNQGSGTLIGEGLFDTNMPPYVEGAVDEVPITIVDSPLPTDCAIQPPKWAMGTQEAADFHVTCTANSVSVPCVGADWAWESLNGDFVFRDNTHAIAFSTSPHGAKGALRYSSGTAVCRANVTINNTGPNGEPKYVCEFDPNSASVLQGGSVYFKMICRIDGVVQTPDDAMYALNPTTLGSNSNSSVGGTTFDAGQALVQGHQYGLGIVTIAPYPTLGGVAIADLKVVNDTKDVCVGANCTNHTTCTGPNCNNKPPGSSDFCTIWAGPWNAEGFVEVFPGSHIYMWIGCGKSGLETCDPNTIFVWDKNKGSGGYSYSGSTSAIYVVGTQIGDEIQVLVYDKNDKNNQCTLDFDITQPSCYEIS